MQENPENATRKVATMLLLRRLTRMMRKTPLLPRLISALLRLD